MILAASPTSLNLGSIQKGSPVEQYISLTGKDKDAAKITSVDTRLKNYLYVETSDKGFENEPDQKIKVTLKNDIPVGRFSDRIIITTDHQKVPQIMVNVFGLITGKILVTPRNLSFGIFEKGQEISRKIDVKSQSDNTFKIEKVSSNIPDILTDIKTIEKNRHYEIHIKTKKNIQTDVLRGELVIETDDKEEKTLSVRVFGRVKKD